MAGYRKYTDESAHTAGGEVKPRPRRAVRLMDMLDGEAPRRRPTPPPNKVPAQSPGDLSTDPRQVNTDLPLKSAPVSMRPPSEPVPVPADGYAILSVHPEGEGETVAVILSVPASAVDAVTAGKDTADGDKPARVKLRLLVEQYTELNVRAGEIDPDTADRLLEAGKLCAAIRRGMTLLQYGDQSARRLVLKLTAKGIDRAVATEAAAYLSEKGYIREDDTARLRAEQGVRKLWGPRRIREDLRAQGFTADAVEDAMAALADVDFEANCAVLIRKKYGCIPDDRAARQKMTAAILRLGYDTDIIRQAMRSVLRENG